MALKQKSETEAGQSGSMKNRQHGTADLRTSETPAAGQPVEIVLLNDLPSCSLDDCPFESEETGLASVEAVSEMQNAPRPLESLRRGAQRPLWLTAGSAAVIALALIVWASSQFANQNDKSRSVAPSEHPSLERGVASDSTSSSGPMSSTVHVENDKDADLSTTLIPGNRADSAGTLIIDAVPWGTVADVMDSHGSRITLGHQRYTPLVLSLPSDVYTISIKDPSSTVTTNLTVEVVRYREIVARAVFKKVDAQDYFRRAGLQDIQ